MFKVFPFFYLGWGGQTKTICSSLKTNRNKTITIPVQNGEWLRRPCPALGPLSAADGCWGREKPLLLWYSLCCCK